MDKLLKELAAEQNAATEQIYSDLCRAYSRAIVEVMDKYFPESARYDPEAFQEAERINNATRKVA